MDFLGAVNIALWCNGNTTGFGSVIIDSSPLRATEFCIFS